MLCRLPRDSIPIIGIMFSSIHRASVHAAVLAATLLAGCSNLDVPRADNYPATGQKKARAVHQKTAK